MCTGSHLPRRSHDCQPAIHRRTGTVVAESPLYGEPTAAAASTAVPRGSLRPAKAKAATK